MKLNKAYIKELRKDPLNWRNVSKEKRLKQKLINSYKDKGLSEEEIERLLKAQGLI